MTNCTMEENDETITIKEIPPSPSLEDNSPSSSTSKENVVTNGGIRCAPLSTLLENTSLSPKRKKKVVTLNQKLQIIKKLDEGASLKELATEYNLGVLTICKIYKKKDAINPVVAKWGTDNTTIQRKSDKSSKYSDLDKVMLEWLQEVREVKKPLKYSHILARAKRFYKATTGSMEGFSSSKGWWRLFRRQNGLHKGAPVDLAATEYNCNRAELKEKPFPKANEENETESSQIGDQFVSTKLDGEMAQIKYTTAVDCIKTVISYLKQDTNTPYTLIQDAQSIYEHIMSQCKLKKQKKEDNVVANGCQWPTPDIDVTSPSQKSNNNDTDSPVLRPRQRKRRISADKSLTSWSCTISGPTSNSIRLRLKGSAEDEGMSEGKHQCSECEATFDEAAQLDFHIVTHFTKQESLPRVNRNTKKVERKVNFNGRRKEQKNRINGAVFKSPLSPVTRLSVSGSYKAEEVEFDSEDECQDLCHPVLPKKRRHRCLYCAKIFPKSAHLASHLRTHANKVFSCDVCGIAFNELQDLKKHCEEVHAILDSPGEKPFKCMLCERLFKKKCHLIWHIQNHSFSSPVKVETPFKCDLCDRAFKLKCNLTWHQRTHKELIEEKVKVCEPLSLLPDDVKGNAETEVDNFPFRCQVCKRTFRKNCNLKVHEKTHSHSSLSADVQVKWEDTDSLCDDVVDDSMGLDSAHSDGSDNLVKDNGGHGDKDEMDESLASDTGHELSEGKLNTSGEDDMVNFTEVHGIGRVSKSNCSRKHDAENGKSLNFRGRRNIIKYETANSLNITEDELLDITEESNLVKDDTMNSADIQKFRKDDQTMTKDTLSWSEGTQNLTESTQNSTKDTLNVTKDAQNLAKDTLNLTVDTQNLNKDTQNLNKDTQNQNKDTQNLDRDTQNLTIDTENLTKDTQNLTENTQNLTENTQNLKDTQILTEDTQNLNKDSQNLNKDSQNLSEGTQSLTRDTQTLTKDTQNFAENTQTFAENTQTLIKDTQNFAENTQTLIKDTQSFAENTQDQTENTQNLIKDENVNLTDNPDIKNMILDDSSNITKTETSDMDDSLEPGIELPFRCKFCARSFKKNCNLKWHEKCHSKKRLKRSSYWDDSCSEGDDLDDLELQSDLLPFKCSECNRAFKMNCHLKRHQKTHIQESDEEPEIIDEEEINCTKRGIGRRSGIRRCVRRCVINSYNVNKVKINQTDFNNPNTYRSKVNKLRMNTTPCESSPEVNRPYVDVYDIDTPDTNIAEVNRLRRNIRKERPFINRPFIDSPGINRPNVYRLDVNEPNLNGSYGDKRNLNRSGVDEPNLNRLDVNEPDLNRLDANKHYLNRPDMNRTSINRPNMNTPSVNTPSISRPDLNGPNINTPSINGPEISEPNTHTPDTDRPSVNSPNIDSDVQQTSFMHADEGESSCLSPEDIESLIKKEIEDNIEEYDAYIDSIVKVEHDVTFDVMIKEEPDDTFELECY